MDKDVSGALRRLLLLAMLGLPLAAAAAVEPQRLVDAARAQVGVTLGYDPAYRQLDYPGGDVPLQGLLHIGVLSDRRLEGRPLVLHNIGAGVREEDLLFRYQVIGHYRFPQG
ncbi:DUF1287 domain-containing protein [Pseudomonas aeruginosa]|uniref:DUF1287 domain-containing protein n=1 Tax=Pseudomonas aeruginosa TaxID=287 RepID=UPI001046EDA6|nr:DUF1287 domain-containing protein [Pseudomonas aeruginosa]